jgi:hypothetical protein
MVVKILKKFKKFGILKKKSKKIKKQNCQKDKKLSLLILGWKGTSWRPIFGSSHEKCIFHFRSDEIGFLFMWVPNWA